MPTWLLSLTLFLPFLGVALPAATERAVERTFPVDRRAKVKVDTFYGSIQVNSAARSDLKIVVRQSIDAPTEEAADRILKDLDLRLEQASDGAIDLRLAYKKAMRWTWDKWPPLGLEIELSVPMSCDLDLVSHDGAIGVGNLTGEVKIRAMQGRVFVGEIDGPLTIWSAKGDIAVTACRGELNLTTREGNINVGRSFGPAEISGVGGEVEVQEAHGMLQAESDGSEMKIGFAYPLKGDSRLRASGGGILATFDPKTPVTIEAQASTFGKVSLRDLPIHLQKGEIGGRRLQGTLNGGGPHVVLRSSGGNVRLLGVPAMPE